MIIQPASSPPVTSHLYPYDLLSLQWQHCSLHTLPMPFLLTMPFLYNFTNVSVESRYSGFILPLSSPSCNQAFANCHTIFAFVIVVLKNKVVVNIERTLIVLSALSYVHNNILCFVQ